ncbi:MAG: manganese efflux pump [Lachnospiraceae bacterium]|nr:manganese efflux pump [Lachnospiraceae bacterium]
MGIVFLIMIAVGLSMEFYAVVVCKSALLASIDRRRLAVNCLMIGIWQLISLAVGNLIGRLLNILQFTAEHHAMNALLSIVIFGFLALHMAKSAWKNESIIEKRISSLAFRQIGAISFHFGFYSMITGLALSLLSIPVASQTIVFCIIILSSVLLAFYTGYRFGYEQKTKAYVIGCILLLAGVFMIGAEKLV